MADLNQMFSALEKADAAGNVDDAREIAAMIRQFQAQPQESETSALGSFGHGVLRGALPAAAGIISGAAGATAGMVAGPVGAIAGGLGAGFAGSAAAAAAQEKFLEANPDFAKAIGLDPATFAKETKANPYSSMAGEIAPNLLAFRPSGALFRSGKGLEAAAAERLAAEKSAAISNAILNTGVGAGVQAGQEAMGEEPIDWTKVGIAGLGGALGQKETSLGRGLTRIGEIPASAATKASLNALRRPGETIPKEEIEIPPSAGIESAEVAPKSASQDYQVMMDMVSKPGETVSVPIKPIEEAPVVMAAKDIPDGTPVDYSFTNLNGEKITSQGVVTENKDGKFIKTGTGVLENGNPAYEYIGMDKVDSVVPIKIEPNVEKSTVVTPPDITTPEVKASTESTLEAPATITEPIATKTAAPAAEEVLAPPTEKLSAEHEELGKTLRSSLNQMGLDHIGLSLQDSLQGYVNGRLQPITGQYLKDMITLSLQGKNIPRTMNHESLHAMKDHGFFSDNEWKILSAKAEKNWLQKYKIEKDYIHLAKDAQHEEAIAKAFADYRTQPSEIKSIMSRAVGTLKRIGNVFRGRGFQNENDIFQAAATNKLTGERIKTSAEAKFETEAQKAPAKNVLSSVNKRNIGQWKNAFPEVDIKNLPKTTEPSYDVSPNTWIQENIIRKFQDKHIDLKRTVAAIKNKFGEISEQFNPYQKDGLWKSDAANQFEKFNSKDLQPLAKKIDELNLTTKEVTDYLHNKHAEQRNKQMNKVNPDVVDADGTVHEYALKNKGSGIHTDDAKAYLDNLPKDKKAALENVAKDVYKIVRETQEILLKSGQKTQEEVDSWRNTYGDEYVPLQRDMEEEFMRSPLGGKGMATKNIFEKRAMGSEREVLDILNSIVGQREVAIENSAKMKVDHALFGMFVKYPNPDLAIPVSPKAIKNPELLARELDNMGLNGDDIVGMMIERQTRTLAKNKKTGLDEVVYKTNPLERYKDNVLPIRINGEDSYLFFNTKNPVSANMAKAFRGMDTPTVGLFGQQVGKVTQWMAKVNTQWNPVFGVINFTRDFGSAMANLSNTELAGQQSKVAGGIKSAMGTIWHTMRTGEYPDTDLGKLYKEFRENGGQTLYREQLSRRADQENVINEHIKKLNSNAAKKMASGFFKGLSDFNDSIENAIRLSAYKVARDKNISAQKSATIAKELTVNFDRKGAYGQAVNNYFAFFNASAQGTARMAQTLKGPAGKKIVLGGIGLGALQAGMMEMAGFGDNDPPEFVKSRNLIIPTPDGKYLAIPYPLGLHFLPNIGRIVVETGLHGDFNKHAGNMAAVIADSFNPLGGGDLSLQTIAPTALDPVVALATNRDPFGRPIAKLDRTTSPTTGLSRSREQSSDINKHVAEAINYITGGTEDTKGFLSPTADQLDYLVGQATGGVGREAMKIGKTATAVVEGKTEDLASYNIPLAGRFYGDTQSPAANSQHFYDNVTKMAEHEATIKGMRERKENVAEYMKENPDARLWQKANNSENQISAINKRQKQMRKMGADEDQIKLLDDRKQQIMTRLNERIKATQE